MQRYSKIILTILDGFGVASPSPSNGVTLADPPFFKELIAHYPTKILQASGPAVGLPWGERGNSEVGHLNIGAGRVVTQELTRINMAIVDGSFFKNANLLGAMKRVVENNTTLHIAGLIGPGSVHAYEQHLYSLLGMAADQGVKNIALHVFTDGRDAPPKSALESVKTLEKKLADEGIGVIASVTGRFYAMDRGQHWHQTQATVNAILKGKGEVFNSASEALTRRYEMGITDEMIPPSIIKHDNLDFDTVLRPGDSLIIFNFRNDRMVQLLKMLWEQSREVIIVTMTMYDPTIPVAAAFSPMEIRDSLSEIISRQGWKQFRAAESEKYAHVTFFFNGHRFDPWPGEERFIVKSPSGNLKNYEDVPEMSAKELTEVVATRIVEADDKFILVNYANADMVGHTGNIEAVKKAVLVLDDCLSHLADITSQVGALLIITADHGNCEHMKNPISGEIDKEHSTNPVPLIFYADDLRIKDDQFDLNTLAGVMPSGILPDIAPTILKFMGLEVPLSMTGVPLKLGNSAGDN